MRNFEARRNEQMPAFFDRYYSEGVLIAREVSNEKDCPVRATGLSGGMARVCGSEQLFQKS
jgi:hypothetical protein